MTRNNSGFYNSDAMYGPFLPNDAPSSRPTESRTPTNAPSTSTPETNEWTSYLTNLGKTITSGFVTKITTPKTGDAADVKAICGRRPLLNLGGKKDAYDACAQNYVNSKNTVVQAPAQATGLSGMAWAGIIGGSVLVVGGLIYAAIKLTGKAKA